MARPQPLARPLNTPQPIAVRSHAQVDGDRPVAVRWRGQWRQVTSLEDVWITDDLWWRPDEQVSRRYFTVLLDDAHHLTIYQDLLRGGWYSQRG